MVSFLALLDDVSALLDDTAGMAKIAAKKTVSILGDDLAVNAEQSARFSAKRELFAIWEIVKGSMINKLIILPIIFLLAYFLPVAITALLMAGGIYLAFEGIEAIIEFLSKHKEEESIETESEKIKGAVKTDFVLSIEIVVIALSTVMGKPFEEQAIVVTAVAFGAIFFVYGIVAAIVRLDDIGLWLIDRGWPKIGMVFVNSLKWIVKSLAVIGTLAMLLVAGGIFEHNVNYLHHIGEHMNIFLSLGFELIIGSVVGLIAVSVVKVFKKIKS